MMDAPAARSSLAFAPGHASTYRRLARVAAPIGACVYVLTFWVPTRTDYSLLLLAGCAAVALLASSEAGARLRLNPLVAAVLCFCLATIASLAASVAVARSLVACAALLPAMLLFVVIGYGFSS